jgi:hypothetical protein
MKLKVTALATTLLLLAAPVGAAGKMKHMGSDPALDAPPALDITYLEVGRDGTDLKVHIGINGMLPAIGGYPALPGIQWAFVSNGRTFIAEAFVDGAAPAFLLFEDEGDSFTQLATLEGTYDFADGFIGLDVPLKLIDAKKGSKIKGISDLPDVDAHVHFGVTDYVADTLDTTKSFIVP